MANRKEHDLKNYKNYEVGANTTLNSKLDVICKNLETLNMKVNGGSTSSPFGGVPKSESYNQ